jgi:hypothetical protein
MQCIINGKLRFDHLLHYEKAFSEEMIAYNKTKVTISIFFFEGVL